ncbi:cobalamin biosynthesis protein CobW [Hylemonella gracilis str. Niagara R]|uniref:Cobalamin biosynthesis protein CobW n=1 Tax=Hylemonella gracilis str. Niagara R TaxID=1458275 RepID=A0A016XJ41_9BURK|nr:cobalamin biosynthesis protein CobW [Hylemonella gracilis]EYC51542.1 cobalamin biosynthesis protein CobW [Hylemonella gracilis str. Niagara R]
MTTRKIPATIVTGFLGSGKTTLLRYLLANAQGRRIAVIVNEFGELGIDGEIMRGCGIGCDDNGEDNGQLFELANGCLCCTVQEEFAPVMEKLAARRDQIDHLVIETSGLALPKPLVQAFQWPALRNTFTVDAVITVVDAPAVAAGDFADDPVAVDAQRRADENLDHDSPLHELFEDQLATADLVVVHKTDGVSAAELAGVEAAIRAETQPGVKLVHAQHGRIDIDVLLGLERAVEDQIDRRKTHHDEEEDHDHDAFDSVQVALDVTSREGLLAALQDLVARHEIYRVKGFVALPGAAMRLVVQGVGARFDSYFDRAWAMGENRQTRLVLIGSALDEALLQAELEAVLAAPASPAVTA